MPASSFPLISLPPLDSDNTNRIATMKNIQVVYTTFNAYGARITTLENNYGTTSSGQTNLGNRVTTLENNYGSLSTTVGTLNTNYNNLNTTVTNQGNTLSTATGNITTLQNNYGTLSTTVTNQGTTLSTATGNITTLQGQVSTLQGKVRYDITTFSSGTCLSSERISDFTASVAFSVPANLSGSVAKARVAPAASFVFSIRKNGTQFATLTFASGSTTGTFSGSATSFAVGDQIDILAQSATDALSDISITLVGTR